MTNQAWSAPNSRLAAATILVMATVLAFTVAVVPDSSTSRANALFSWNNANVTHVAVGNEHTCAIQNGVLFCWGAGTGGQLGYLPPARPPVLPQARDQLVPVRVSPASGFLNSGGVTAVSAGGAVTCAIENKVLYCWGSNGVAQIGIGTFTSSVTTPRKVSAANGFLNNNVTAVSVDGSGVCAIEGGVAYCWGANGLGAVGNGQRTDVSVPHPSVPQKVQPTGDFANSGVTAIARSNTTCAVEAGEVFCWGAGNNGEMGNGTLTQANLTPVKVGSGTDGFSNNNVVDVSTGGVGVCATRNEGANRALYCWGNGGSGNLGFGAQVLQQTRPRKVVAMKSANPSVSSITTGLTSCAVDDGTLYCFGINWNGQIGDGTTTMRLAPVRVSSTGGMPNVAVTMVAAENGFAYHTCAIEGGSAYCWGKASKGQLGNEETSPDRWFPVAAASKPGAPTITAATVGTTTATVTVSAGAGGVATSFTVTASATNDPTDVQTCTFAPPATGCTLTGLTGGTQYTFVSIASSEKGSSPASNTVTRTTGATATPDAPDVVAGIGSVTVSVNPTTSGGTPTGYIATSQPDGGTCTMVSPATSCVISPLTDGSTSAVTLVAFNDDGSSPASGATTVTVGAAATPDVPTIVVGSQSVTVSVNPTTSGGTPSQYTVSLMPGGHTCTVPHPDTTCVISGLTNGVTYTVTTSATNGGGTSAPSAPVTQLVDIIPLPAVPTVEVRADGVTVSVASLPEGGTPQMYVVTLSGTSGSTSTLSVTLTPPATTAALNFPGLTVGEHYSVTVSAINGIGSATNSAQFQYAAPAAPQIGVLTIASTSATVTVSAGTPGGPPSSYVVYVGPGSCTIDAPDTSCTVTGLNPVNGNTYTATASATNGLGTATNSGGISVLFAAPGAPDGAPTVEVGNAMATVSVAPVTTGGRPAFYVVTASASGQPTRTCVATVPDTSCTISPLTNGITYTFTSLAVNDFGTSPDSASADELVDVAPAIPNHPTVVVGSGGVTISASSPSGGGSVVQYQAVVMPDGLTCTVNMPASPASCFIPLSQNGGYTVTTTAINNVATSSASSPVEFRFDGPAAPEVQNVTIGLGAVTVSVAPGTGATAGAATLFTVFVGSSSCTVVPPATTCTVTGLTDGQSYDVTASATNGIGTTPSTGGLQARLIPPNAPPAPIVVIDSATSATVYVNPPIGGETPSSYTVTATTSAGVGASCTVTSPDVSCQLMPLTQGAEYSVDVVAKNAYGPSAAGDSATALMVRPPTPLAPLVTPGNEQATVTVRPGSGGGPASEYVVFVEPGGLTCDGGGSIRPPATSCVVSGLTNDVEYTFSMLAANGVGGSSVSAVALATPRMPVVPPPPTTTTTTTTPPNTTTPPTTRPPSTRPPTTTTPTTTVPPVVDPATGVLPELAPGESNVIVDGAPVPAQVSAVSPTEVVMVSTDFELRLVAECSSLCPVVTTTDGVPVIQLESTGGVRVSGVGFLPGSVAYVWLFSDPRLLGTVIVNADGTFAGTLPVGALESGEHTLQVTGVSRSGAPKAANLGVLVTEVGVPTPGPGRLPATGNGSSSNVVTLALLAVLSGAITLSGRRRLTR